MPQLARPPESFLSPDSRSQAAAAPVLTEAPTGAFLEPLLRVAPSSRWLLLGAGLLALVAAGLVLAGLTVAALVVATAAVTLGLFAAAATTAERLLRARQTSRGAIFARAAAHDPDPVIVTDLQGRACAVNRAAADSSEPIARLEPWCVDSAQVAGSLMSEVRRRGSAVREFWRQGRGLRLTLHFADEGRDLIVWHFAPTQRGGARGIEALGLPVLTRDGGEVRANAAARLLAEGHEEAILAGIESAQRAGAVVPIEIDLPGGQPAQALPVPARDGLTDVVLVPLRALGGVATAAPPAAIFEEIPVALAQIDAQGRIDVTNRHARALLGLTADEPRFFWEVVEGLGRPVADWLDDARAGRALGRPEVLRATMSGQETYVQIILRRATGQNSEGVLVAVISDATEFKSLEARFVQSQKMQAIGQLAGGIAHDFNNLLTAISGHCDLLLLNRDRFDPDYNDLLQIHQNANRAAALVRQLLAFSRKQTLKPEVVSLESLLEDLTHLLTRLVGERISLSLTHDPEVAAIRADRRQLEQVIMNLVVNARDAMPMGGTIRIETEARHLPTGHAQGRAQVPPGEYAVIRVIDQGIGIPADIIDKIFEPFFTTKKVGEGTGLGLSTAYGIVKQMGGYIFADSVEGAGTVFSLYFGAEPHLAAEGARPLAPPPPAEAPEAGAPPPPAARETAPSPKALPKALHGGSVLLVEDEAPVRAFAARALRLQGYQVFEAQDGEQALDFLADPAIRVDLFVTDVVMPGIDGPGWVAEALHNRPGTPVVFMSGYTEDTLSAALVRIPRAVFLGKPFSLRDLSETIARQLAPDGVASPP